MTEVLATYFPDLWWSVAFASPKEYNSSYVFIGKQMNDFWPGLTKDRETSLAFLNLS